MLKGKKFDAFTLQSPLESPFKGFERTFKGSERTFKGSEQTFKGFERRIINSQKTFLSVDNHFYLLRWYIFLISSFMKSWKPGLSIISTWLYSPKAKRAIPK